MNSILKKVSDRHMVIKKSGGLVSALLFLMTFTSTAQTCIDNYTLESETIQSGNSIAYQVNHSISSIPGKIYIVESKANANFKAGNRIELNPGFRVETGAVFTATLEPCNGSGTKRSVTVFPNPTAGLLTINSLSSIYSATLSDMNSQLIFEKKDINDNVFSLDMSDLKNGFYILEIISNGNTEKIRIEKN